LFLAKLPISSPGTDRDSRGFQCPTGQGGRERKKSKKVRITNAQFEKKKGLL